MGDMKVKMRISERQGNKLLISLKEIIKPSELNYILKNLWKFRWHYIMILPGIVLLFLFAYMPIMGVQIAFKEYDLTAGIWKSPWVGLKNFYFLQDPYFWHTVKNTLAITIYRLMFGFPIPIIFALLLNEVRNEKFKKVIQTVSYLPHFVSWIVVAYILTSMLALDTGVVNFILEKLGFSQIFFLGEPKYFRAIVVISAIWKEMGWSSIIYLAALANINPELYEAALIDGAGRFARIRYITIPGIMPTVGIILILSMPGLLSAGYEQIYPLVNPANMSVSEVLDVYIIRLGLVSAQYSISAAIGLILGIVQMLLVLTVNFLIKKSGGVGLW
jgi:putative aldouronate transport system permease protein